MTPHVVQPPFLLTRPGLCESVRAELVEAQPFDKLRANGIQAFVGSNLFEQ